MQLANRLSIEANLAAAIAKLNEYERALIEPYLGNPPKLSDIPIAVWELIERERKAALIVLLMGIFMTSARQHGGALGLTDETAATLSHEWSQEHAEEAAEEYVQSTQRMLDAEFGKIALEIKPPVVAGASEDLPVVTESVDLGPVFNRVFGPERLQATAITETTNAAVAGGEAAIEATVGLTMTDEWRTAEDEGVCLHCRPLEGTPREEWELVYPDGPPAHTRCRCYLLYSNLGEVE